MPRAGPKVRSLGGLLAKFKQTINQGWGLGQVSLARVIEGWNTETEGTEVRQIPKEKTETKQKRTK